MDEVTKRHSSLLNEIVQFWVSSTFLERYRAIGEKKLNELSVQKRLDGQFKK